MDGLALRSAMATFKIGLAILSGADIKRHWMQGGGTSESNDSNVLTDLDTVTLGTLHRNTSVFLGSSLGRESEKGYLSEKQNSYEDS
jgi:hypothetical protein